MGQYYTPILVNFANKDKIKTFLCYDYNNGAKLMEHSYLGNSFVEVVVKQLINKPQNMAWVGDYAEVEDVEREDQKQWVEKFIKFRSEEEKYYKKPRIGVMENSFNLCFINHTLKEYFYMSDYAMANNNYGWIIHPLPLLTAIGNGKGGGDYRGTNTNLVGRWACNLIEVKTWIDEKKYPDYKNITSIINFKEG